MPYSFESRGKKLPPEKDRRRHLTEAEKEEIKKLYEDGWGIRQIARKFEKKCSRRLIQFILFPSRLALAKEQFKERRKDGRYKYSRKEWAARMREHRAYKHKVLTNS